MYKILSNEESMEVLKASYLEYACDCCPTLPEPVEKVQSFSQIVGVYSVKSDAWARYKKELIAYIHIKDSFLDADFKTYLINFINELNEEEFLKNTFEKESFKNLRTIIDNKQSPEYAPFELIRKSSPKFSNFLASILKYCGDNPDNHKLMKNFNDRGSAQFSEFEMVISTEPHRIAGMSAYGKFTSCQDWIEKDYYHEYHNYTHSAWANLLDETVGIVYLRRKTDQAPSVEYSSAEDMLARRLVRIAELPNGQNVLYIHRMYACAPYDRYLNDTLKEWKKTLPDNFHYFDLQNYNWDDFVNKHGIKYSGTRDFTHVQNTPYVYAAELETCDNCGGYGTVDDDCDRCDGDGYIVKEDVVDCDYCEGTGEDKNGDICCNCDGEGWYETEYEEECWDCSGSGRIEEDCSECYGDGKICIDREFYPYNDHCTWLNLESYDGIKFTVPECYFHWDEKPEPEPKTTKYLPQVGDKVRIRPDLPHDPQKLYRHRNGEMNTVNSEMWELRGRIVTIVGTNSGTQFKIDLDGGRWNWTDEMFDTQIRVGDIVALRPDLEVGKKYREITLHPLMYEEATRAGTFKIVKEDDEFFRADFGFWWTPEMLYLVEPRTEVMPNEEVEQATV